MKDLKYQLPFAGALGVACFLSLGQFEQLPQATTGAPGEMTCQSCHNDIAVMGTGATLLGLPVYVINGQAYDLTMRIHRVDLGWTAGFQSTFLGPNLMAQGNLVSLEPNVDIFMLGNRQYAQHGPAKSFAGIISIDTVFFQFRWTPGIVQELTPVEVFYSAVVVQDGVLDEVHSAVHTVEVVSYLGVSVEAFQHLPCDGSQTGELEAMAFGGLEPYSYQWSNGAGTSVISGLGAGVYLVTVTDALGQVAVSSGELAAPPPLTAHGVIGEPTCPGDSDGSILVEILSGTPPYTYALDGILVQGPLIPGLPAGTYQVDVGDANGCAFSFSIEVSGPLPVSVLVIDVAPQTVSTLGAIIIEINGGTPPYDFFWVGPDDFNSTMQNPFNLIAGEYFVTITDALDCQQFFSVVVDFSSSIGEPVTEQMTLHVSPNPGTSHLQVVLPAVQTPDWDIRILTATGHLMLHDAVSGTEFKIHENLENWPPGVYLIVVRHRWSAQLWTRRWLKHSE